METGDGDAMTGADQYADVIGLLLAIAMLIACC